MICTATITTASLRLRESRIIAGPLLRGVSGEAWKEAILEENVLQLDSIESINRISRLLRARLAPIGEELWRMVNSLLVLCLLCRKDSDDLQS